MLNREYHIRANRRGKLQGQQLDISFPRRGRPSRIRVLERCGQMRLDLAAPKVPKVVSQICDTESFDAALQMTFPVRPMTENELLAEFNRLFPPD